MENHIEIWQTQVNGQIYESNFEELTEWINEGSLLPQDMVRRGNLRWIEARKVPTLVPFFNAKEQGIEPPPIQTTVTTANEIPAETFSATENFIPESSNRNSNFSSQEQSFQPNQDRTETKTNSETTGANVCALHPENEARFHCETCGNFLCPQCPKSYGGNVKICPICGAMCKKIGELDLKQSRELRRQNALAEGFGFSDIVHSFSHPFKFTTSLLFGGAMYMVFTVGQSAVSFGGIVMIFPALVCFLLANMLSFGILANTVEKFSKGETGADFMPGFDDFNLMDDVLRPFFLSIGVYISSFGPALLVTIFTAFVFIGFAGDEFKKNQLQNDENQNIQSSSPFLIDEKKASDQSEEVRKLLESVKQNANEKKQLTENGLNEQNNPFQNEEPKIAVQENKDRQLGSIVNENKEAQKQGLGIKAEALVKRAIFLFILLALAMLWGIFYFPAACAVAGYTRSFRATIDPSVGINTIKTLGIDYVKILAFFILIGIAMTFISGFLWIMLASFNLIGAANIPATAVTSWFTFYFTIVFSCVLGHALYKNSDKFKFYKG